LASEESNSEKNSFEKLKAPIQEIIKFADTFDERYREKCFEVLLNSYLSSDGSHKLEDAQLPKAESKTSPTTNDDSELPLDIQAFLQQNEIPNEVIAKLFLRHKNEVRPIYKIKETKKATAQIQIALLSAFENALINPDNTFEFSIDEVRKRCGEHNVYNSANFSKTFRTNANLFKDLTTDEEHVKLTPEGKTELAEALLAVAKQ
jgi:hypothetical protein